MQRIAKENQELIDHGEVPKGKRGQIVSWKKKLRGRPQWKRPCIHHMKGRIEFRACHHDYRCGTCEFDQYFQDQFAVHAMVKSVDMIDIRGFKVPQGYYFHRGHTWIKVEEGSSVRVGLDDFIWHLIGPFDRIEAPLMGKEVQQDKEDTLLFRGPHQANVLSPVSGVVTAVNTRLREGERRLAEDPYGEGWLMTIHAGDLREDLKNLMIGSETDDALRDDVDRLYDMIEEAAGPITADGGHLGKDIFGKLPDLGWERLAKTFLKT
jgi:glycine cleavage system H lipoate-binding protein